MLFFFLSPSSPLSWQCKEKPPLDLQEPNCGGIRRSVYRRSTCVTLDGGEHGDFSGAIKALAEVDLPQSRRSLFSCRPVRAEALGEWNRNSAERVCLRSAAEIAAW